MAFFIFGTSVCFAVDRHICEGEVWSVSYFGQADVCEKMKHDTEPEVMSCCMAVASEKKTSDNETQISKVPCCSQEVFVNSLDGKQEVISSDIDFDISTLYIDLSENYLFSLLTVDREVYTPRPPPDIRRDFLSLFQVFLI